MLPDCSLLEAARALIAKDPARFVPSPAHAEWRQTIDSISRERGLDLATVVVFEITRSRPANADFARAVAATPPARQVVEPDGVVTVGLVPGAFYREHHNTGADGARVIQILRALGYPTEIIPVPSFGRLEENAAFIRAWLDRQGGKPTALVSLSKGACDVKTALMSSDGPARGFAHVRAWISLSGITSGTPLVAWLRRRPWRWCGVWLILRSRGHRMQALRELRHGPDAPLSRWPNFPENLRVVHAHGFPLRHHLAHPWAHRAYRRLAPLGPNDGGGVLLADVATWPGIVYPLWAVDHYMQPRWPLDSELSRVFQAALA